MNELLTASHEFEPKPHHEIEKKYLPLFPEALEQFRAEAVPIEQLYLSHPDEDFSLRIRETLQEGELQYEATLKNRGSLTTDGIDRLEVTTPVTADIYHYYKRPGMPTVRKLRAEPTKHIAIDWFEDGHVHIESEHPIAWSGFTERYGLERNFVEITGDHIADNEWRAQLLYRKSHDGKEVLAPLPELDAGGITQTIWQNHLHSPHVLATISGRSGSGKSTFLQEVKAGLTRRDLTVAVLSTDDYHRGKTWLENYKGGPWTDWDAPIVYDLESLKADLAKLRSNTPIAKRYFDFQTEEPVTYGIIEPAQVILLEGIYARNDALQRLAHVNVELPTSLATSVGRRLLRDLAERPQFADPERSLRYILEQAEPAYEAQSKPQQAELGR